MKSLWTILLLALSNTFMTFAWYGHLRFKDLSWAKELGLLGIILVSWGIAFFEYCLQVPANRMGYLGHGGPFSLVQLKVVQEVTGPTVSAIFTLTVFRHEQLKWDHLAAAVLMVAAVWLVFKDRQRPACISTCSRNSSAGRHALPARQPGQHPTAGPRTEVTKK